MKTISTLSGVDISFLIGIFVVIGMLVVGFMVK
jgi:hypothetical protein